MSLNLHVTFISALGLTRDLDTCPCPYIDLDIYHWPYMWSWYLSLALHVTLIHVLGLTRDLDTCPWPYIDLDICHWPYMW